MLYAFVIVGQFARDSERNQLGEAAADASLREIISAAKSNSVLLWASFGGSIVALVMVLLRRDLSLSAAVDAWVAGDDAPRGEASSRHFPAISMREYRLETALDQTFADGGIFL